MHREAPMLPSRETESIEFKKTLSELKEGIISLTSMLNKGGVAHLYFGIKNDGTVFGQKIAERKRTEDGQTESDTVLKSVIETVVASELLNSLLGGQGENTEAEKA